MGTLMRPALLLLVVVLTAALSATGASAIQGFVAPLDEIPLTSPLLTGARALGMGGAALAIGDDASSLAANPAALARLRRIEFAGGLMKDTQDLSGDAFGRSFGTKLSRTNFSSIRFAYPIPTFRGSLVVGLSGDRVYDFGVDFVAAYQDPVTWRNSDLDTLYGSRQIEDMTSSGGIYAWTAGAAFDASPTISLGASVSYWSGSYSRDFTWTVQDAHTAGGSDQTYALTTSSDADASGVRGKVGALFYITDGLTGAVVVNSPITVTFDVSEVTRESWPETQPPYEDVIYFKDRVKLPFTFEAGLAYTPIDLLLLAADVSYTDWSEMTDEGALYLGTPSERRNAYRATTDYRLGAEFTVPSWPLRLRAGYMSRPIAYRGLEVDTDRSYFTLGGGVLVDTVLDLELAWIQGTDKRSVGAYPYSEKLDDKALVFEAAYRF
jgi:long-subunit fatty acid transport protein